MSFYAVSTETHIPEEIRKVFYEKLEIRDVFGTKCYVMIEDDDKTPLNLLDEETHRRVERWLQTVGADSVFTYSWS
ncbi:MAG: hypothetical protein MN733_25210 [Nitrososphaera sp.]|nr:hypothetical protein [Nitrososphaera sp.]